MISVWGGKKRTRAKTLESHELNVINYSRGRIVGDFFLLFLYCTFLYFPNYPK